MKSCPGSYSYSVAGRGNMNSQVYIFSLGPILGWFYGGAARMVTGLLPTRVKPLDHGP